MTDWDAYLMSKPTDTSAWYPTTDAMLAALEDATLEHRITVTVWVATVLVFLGIAATLFILYLEITP